jgi:predicted TIM-barrel fold metal-dependent hydrolase
MYDPVAINNRHVTGIETLMWGNDYPHPEGTWPDSQQVNADQFDGVDPTEVDAIVAGNAARVFGFDLDHLAEIAHPDVVAPSSAVGDR